MYCNEELNFASYTTVVKRFVVNHDDKLRLRWPTILTQIVNTVNNRVHDLSVGSPQGDDVTVAQIQEGKQIISKLSELKHDMGRDYELT